MYDIFSDLIGLLPLRYQFIVPIVIMIFILILFTLVFKMLGGRF